MAKRIIWSANALADRIDILNYWTHRNGNKSYSIKLNNQLINIIENLNNFPNLGIKIDNNNLRCLIKSNYRIYYKISNDDIILLHLWDSRRNPDDLIL